MSGRGEALRLACACMALSGPGGGVGDLPPRLERLSHTQWLDVIELVNEHLLGPALWAALRRRDLARHVPGDVADYLAYLHSLNAARNARLGDQLAEAAAAFNDSGITPVLLKGAITLVEDGASEGGRMIRDLDILIRGDEIEAACAVLHRLGYRCLRDYPGHTQEVADFARPDDSAAIDLHKDLIAFGRHFDSGKPRCPLGGDELIAQAREASWHGVCVRVPSLRHRLLHLILHDQLHDRDYFTGQADLRHVLDIARLMDRLCSEDVADVVRRLADDGLAGAAQTHLLAARDLFDAPFPTAARPSLLTRYLHKRRLASLGEGPDWLVAIWGALAWEMVSVRYPRTSGAGSPLILSMWKLRKIGRGFLRLGNLYFYSRKTHDYFHRSRKM